MEDDPFSGWEDFETLDTDSVEAEQAQLSDDVFSEWGDADVAETSVKGRSPSPGHEDVSTEAAETWPAHPKKKKRRPAGSFGSALLRERMASMDSAEEHPADPTRQPGTIEYARRIREQKLQKKLEQRRVDVAQNNPVDSTRAGSESLTEFGQMTVVNHLDNKLHLDLLQGVARCREEGISAKEEDKLVAHTLDDAMSTVSVRALEKLLRDSGFGSRMLEIATATLELCCCMWAVLLGSLRWSLCRFVDLLQFFCFTAAVLAMAAEDQDYL